jgi:hypothetical protein
MFSARRGQDFHCDSYEPLVTVASTPSSSSISVQTCMFINAYFTCCVAHTIKDVFQQTKPRRMHVYECGLWSEPLKLRGPFILTSLLFYTASNDSLTNRHPLSRASPHGNTTTNKNATQVQTPVLLAEIFRKKKTFHIGIQRAQAPTKLNAQSVVQTYSSLLISHFMKSILESDSNYLRIDMFYEETGRNKIFVS